MTKRKPERPQITSKNFIKFTEAEQKAAVDAWRELALSGQRDLKYAYLRGAKLQGGDWRHAYLPGADLQGANLQDADLRNANLQGADLYNADLRGADLRGAELTGANLQSAKLQSANLFLTDLTGVKNLTEDQLRSARNVLQIQKSEFSEIPEDFRSYAPLNRLIKAQSLRK